MHVWTNRSDADCMYGRIKNYLIKEKKRKISIIGMAHNCCCFISRRFVGKSIKFPMKTVVFDWLLHNNIHRMAIARRTLTEKKRSLARWKLIFSAARRYFLVRIIINI